jgi:threonine dehydrogenase-like Zn-dependent dehydrogenase
MRVGVLYGPMDIRVEEIETPSPGPGEVLLEVKAGGICGGDLHIHRYGYSVPPFRREMSGHELSGRIAALGEDVQQRKIGDRVCVEPLLGCGKCQFCAMGQYNLCKHLQYPGSGFREYLDAGSLITHTFPLDRIKEAFQTGVNKKETGAIKILVTC